MYIYLSIYTDSPFQLFPAFFQFPAVRFIELKSIATPTYRYPTAVLLNMWVGTPRGSSRDFVKTLECEDKNS